MSCSDSTALHLFKQRHLVAMRYSPLQVIVALLVLVGLSPAISTRADICIPAPLPDLQTAQHSADAIFIGKVAAVDDSPFATMGDGIGRVLFDSEHKRVLLNVTSVWKGPVRSQAIITFSARGCARSLFDFHKDQTLLIFANNGALDSLEVPGNSRTRELERAAEDLPALGEGKAPTEKKELETLFYFQSYWSEAVLGVIFISALFWVVKSNRQDQR